MQNDDFKRQIVYNNQRKERRIGRILYSVIEKYLKKLLKNDSEYDKIILAIEKVNRNLKFKEVLNCEPYYWNNLKRSKSAYHQRGQRHR